MGANVQAADNVADLLKDLQVDPQATIRDALEVQANQTSSTQEGLDPSGTATADSSHVQTDYAGMDGGMYYALNGYPAHHGYFIGGYDYPVDWEDYSRHIVAESGDSQNAGNFSDSGALVYHPSGYAYNPQHLYAPYTSGAPMRADGQLYGAHGYPFAGHMYQQPVVSNAPLIPTIHEPSTVTTKEPSNDNRSPSTPASGNNGPSSGKSAYADYPSSLQGRGVLPALSSQTSSSQDVRVSYEAGRAGAVVWSDSSKATEVQQRHNVTSLGQNARPLAPLLPHIPPNQQHRPRGGVSSNAGGLGRFYQPSSRMYPSSSNPGRLGISPGWEPRGSGRNWYALEKEKTWGRGNEMLNNGNPSWDILNDQNRGPRTRGRYQRINPGAVRYVRAQGSLSGSSESVNLPINKEEYNHPDFVCTYEKAKFFIIKSYSEDDIHKSIKYNVWASTANGNKKLDAAFTEGLSSSGKCPVFLFFSVNASGQFCGVAEIVGPVDFHKNLEFWQQDKWTGKVPLKWHIVKDVPNSQFRHIILENNDNKPVTNSRDTQEVPLHQGLEMLNLFKNYNTKVSILDDFQFYETRQKLMQEKRAKQQNHLQQHQQIMHRVNKEMDQSNAAQGDLTGNKCDTELGCRSEKPADGHSMIDNPKSRITDEAQTNSISTETVLGQVGEEGSLLPKASEK